jgi:hypothetical protein
MFVRNLYNRDIEAKHFEPLLAEIERIRSGLASMPLQTSLDFIKNPAMERWLAKEGSNKIVGTIVFGIFNRLQFFWFTSIFKTINLIDALELMYNSKNYIGWVLVGRSIIEHCAVFNYYTQKFLGTDPGRNDFSLSELKAMEDIMIQYSHGTRCNWHDLLAGDLTGFNKNPNEAVAGRSAVNIITALKHLAARKGAFDGIEGVYAMFSDFAHPNMASHSTVVDVTPSDQRHDDIEHVSVTVQVGQPRGEFIVLATLTAICLCIQTVIDLSMTLSPVFRHWEDDLMEGRVRVRFDS